MLESATSSSNDLEEENAGRALAFRNACRTMSLYFETCSSGCCCQDVAYAFPGSKLHRALGRRILRICATEKTTMCLVLPAPDAYYVRGLSAAGPSALNPRNKDPVQRLHYQVVINPAHTTTVRTPQHYIATPINLPTHAPSHNSRWKGPNNLRITPPPWIGVLS